MFINIINFNRLTHTLIKTRCMNVGHVIAFTYYLLLIGEINYII